MSLHVAKDVLRLERLVFDLGEPKSYLATAAAATTTSGLLLRCAVPSRSWGVVAAAAAAAAGSAVASIAVSPIVTARLRSGLLWWGCATAVAVVSITALRALDLAAR